MAYVLWEGDVLERDEAFQREVEELTDILLEDSSSSDQPKNKPEQGDKPRHMCPWVGDPCSDQPASGPGTLVHGVAFQPTSRSVLHWK